MNPILILNQPQVFTGLGTLTYKVPATQSTGYPTATGYNVIVQTTVPTAAASGDGAGSNASAPSGPAVTSSLVITITQNGSTIYTSPTLTPTQRAQQLKYSFLCAIGDVINVVLSSSNTNDTMLNTLLKTEVAFNQGL
jgi:hypothetical protein